MAGIRDDVELFRLCRRLVGVLADVAGLGVLSRDEQDRPRQDPLELREQRKSMNDMPLVIVKLIEFRWYPRGAV